MENECATDLAKEILNAYDSDKDGFITQEEYLVWTVNRSLPEDFLHLLFQVCHHHFLVSSRYIVVRQDLLSK